MAIVLSGVEIILIIGMIIIAAYCFYLQLKYEKLSASNFIIEYSFKKVQEVVHKQVALESSIDISREALKTAQDTAIQLSALKQSTHTVIPVGNPDALKDLEDKFRRVAGIPKEDFNSDLEAMGFSDSMTQNPEDLV